jgi:ADP-ribose pyrophosphatase YjhB (NUDIX family)
MSDGLAARFPVSVKGVVERDGRFVLLKNERDEWELPGGKLEAGETIEDCLVREIEEELNLSTRVGKPLNNWVYYVNGVHVLIITYALQILDEQAEMRVSHEHRNYDCSPSRRLPGCRCLTDTSSPSRPTRRSLAIGRTAGLNNRDDMVHGLSMLPRGHAEADDGFLAERLGCFKSVQALDQHKARAVRPHQDRRLLAVIEHAGRDLVHALLFERGASFDRHVDVGNCKGLALHHC